MNADDSAPRIRYFTPASSDRDPAALKARQHVERDGDQFDGNKQHREIVRRRGEQHSRQRKNDQRIILRNPRRDAVGKLHRQHQHQHCRQQKKAFEKYRQAVLHKHSAERHHPIRAQLQWLVKLFRNNRPSAAAAA